MYDFEPKKIPLSPCPNGAPCLPVSIPKPPGSTPINLTLSSFTKSVKIPIAVEANGSDEYARQFRAYGKHRLVSYAQFLLAHYFPRYERYCESIGISMRAYAMEDAPKELVELNEALAERFRLRYFGRLDALCPSSEMLAFENKWRAVQLEGPLNKGSNIYGAHNMQI